MTRMVVGTFNAKVTSFSWTTPTSYPHVGPILLAFSSGSASKATLDDMSLYPLKSRDAEDRIILGCISRLFGLSPRVLGDYSPRHGPLALMESGPEPQILWPHSYKIRYGPSITQQTNTIIYLSYTSKLNLFLCEKIRIAMTHIKSYILFVWINSMHFQFNCITLAMRYQKQKFDSSISLWSIVLVYKA